MTLRLVQNDPEPTRASPKAEPVHRGCYAHRPGPGLTERGRRHPMRLLRPGTVVLLLLLWGEHGACKRGRKQRLRPKEGGTGGAGGGGGTVTVPSAAERDAMSAWVSGMVGNGSSPEALKQLFAEYAGGSTGGGETAEGARTFGLPKHALPIDGDPRLREPMTSKDSISAAWGWYSGSLDEPAELPPHVIEFYRDHGYACSCPRLAALRARCACFSSDPFCSASAAT